MMTCVGWSLVFFGQVVADSSHVFAFRTNESPIRQLYVRTPEKLRPICDVFGTKNVRFFDILLVFLT